MKKKIVMVTLSLIMAMSVITGCGKSDEQKAKDEIMSHMNDDEKANIAADQKEIENWEKEQQEKQESLAAEQAALPEYSEDILTQVDVDWKTPLKITTISEEYSEVVPNEQNTVVVYKSQIGGLELTYKILDSDGGTMSYAKQIADSGAEDSFYQEIGDYKIAGYDKGGNILTVLITDSENACFCMEFWTTDKEVRTDIYNRNAESLKSQLQ